MFWGEEYNVPPCCDQKYFTKMFSDLREKKTIFIYMQSDYPLNKLLSKILVHMPMSSVKMMLPCISEDFVTSLRNFLGTNWYNGKDNSSFILSKLLLISSNASADLKNRLAPFNERVRLAKADIGHTAILVENKDFKCLFSGSSTQEFSMVKQCFTSMCVSCDKRHLDEFETIFRILSHKNI